MIGDCLPRVSKLRKSFAVEPDDGRLKVNYPVLFTRDTTPSGESAAIRWPYVDRTATRAFVLQMEVIRALCNFSDDYNLTTHVISPLFGPRTRVPKISSESPGGSDHATMRPCDADFLSLLKVSKGKERKNK
jgi:hypothetical protein